MFEVYISFVLSRDHRTVYVGDAKGRVYSWSVTDQPGRVVADHWVKDEGGDNCQGCNVKFSFSERRHHCRNCGQLFCSRYVNNPHKYLTLSLIGMCLGGVLWFDHCFTVLSLLSLHVANNDKMLLILLLACV